MTARAPGSLTSGDSDADFVVGPIEPATQRGLPSSRLGALGGAARDLRGGDVDVAHRALEPVVGERDRRRGERVGLDDVRAGREELVVDVLDRLAAWSARGRRCSPSAECAWSRNRSPRHSASSREPEALDHRAHRAVEHDDAAGEQIAEGIDGGHRP